MFNDYYSVIVGGCAFYTIILITCSIIRNQRCVLFYALSVDGLQEEDILDLLEQCELDDEKLTGKSARQRGPKVRGVVEKPRERERREKNNGGPASRDHRRSAREGITEREMRREDKSSQVGR